MESTRVPFVPFAAPAPPCEACSLTAGELESVTRHVEHVAATLSALEQRQLRSHLFALLAAISGTLVLPE